MRIPRRHGPAMAVAGILVLSGGIGVTPVAAQPLAVPSQAQLQAALLTVANLPSGMGFQSQPVPTGNHVGSFAPCPDAAKGPQPSKAASIGFTTGTGLNTMTLIEGLQQYSAGAALATLKQVADIVSECNNIKFHEAGLDVRMNVEREAFPSYGNGTVALRAVSDITNANDTMVDTDIVAVRHGGIVIVITNTAEAQIFDPSLTRLAVAAAYKKAARLS